jgi:peptidylprolyl isomerase
VSIVRRSLSLFVIATLAATALAGCSSSSADATCTYDEKTGDGVSAVSVKDSFGSAPDAIFATPLKASTNQHVIVSEGDGLVSHAGDTVAVDVSLYDGTTAELLSSTNYDGSGFALLPLDATAQPALAKALECVQVGSRVVAVIGDAPNLTTALELAAGTTLVFVFDVHDVYLGKANGTPQNVPDGFPMIVLAEDGTPGITFLSGATPPSETRIAVLKAGTGATVGADSQVTVAYSGWLWPTDGGTPTQFDSTWANGKKPATFSPSGVVPGFSKALIGQRVGSQIEVIISPEDGYGSAGTGSIPPNSTLVFVIDILGVN